MTGLWEIIEEGKEKGDSFPYHGAIRLKPINCQVASNGILREVFKASISYPGGPERPQRVQKTDAQRPNR